MSIKPRDKDRAYMLLGLRIIGEFGAIIAVPVVLLSLLGKHLDERFGTSPRLLIAGFILAAVISGTSIYRKAKAFAKEYQRIDERAKFKVEG